MLRETTVPADEPGPGAPGLSERPPLAAQFASSPRGARLARRLAVRHMEEWGYPPASDASSTVALVVAELAANAVRHGRVPGHDFALRLAFDAAAGLVRIEVADAASAKQPPEASPSSAPEGESGRGLLLVDALAVRWGSAPRHPLGKTVWAEVPVVSPTAGGEDPRRTDPVCGVSREVPNAVKHSKRATSATYPATGWGADDGGAPGAV